MNNPNPQAYPRRILLVVIGMTPQIVTETLYKLAVDSDPVFIPDEVHIITTREGADSARLALLGIGQEGGWIERFRQDFDLPQIRFTEDMIHVIQDTEGLFLDDNESYEHNRIAADFIIGKMREFTSDEQTALHVSLAGGRKTMSFYAGYALSLYGRTQDRLSHVLVSPPFQNNRDFFYPPPKAERLEIGNRYYSTDDARIVLSDIPFVRMQYQITGNLLGGDEGFRETVEKIEQFNTQERIELDLDDRSIHLQGIRVPRPTASQFYLYYWFCKRKLAGQPAMFFQQQLYLPELLDVIRELDGEFNAIYNSIYEKIEHIQRATPEEGDRFYLQNEYFGPHRTRLEKKFKAALGEKHARPYLISTIEGDRKHRGAGYELDMPADNIVIRQRDGD